MIRNKVMMTFYRDYNFDRVLNCYLFLNTVDNFKSQLYSKRNTKHCNITIVSLIIWMHPTKLNIPHFVITQSNFRDYTGNIESIVAIDLIWRENILLYDVKFIALIIINPSWGNSFCYSIFIILHMVISFSVEAYL